MKRFLTNAGSPFAAPVLLTAAALLSLAAVPAAAKTPIRITVQVPGTHSLGVNLDDWKKCVEAKSDELDIQIFPSAQLYTDKQVPEAVGSGAIEMGTASLTRFAGSVPAVDAVYVPFLLDSPEKAAKFTAPDSPARKIIDDAVLKQTGARILWWQAFGRTIYLSKKEPIRVPADIKGKKVRTFGKLLGWTAETLGGAPTLMSGSKQFLAYQQGAVDVGTTGITGVKSRKLYEVMDYITLTYDADIEFVAVMNNDTYNGLSEKTRGVVDSCGREVEAKLRGNIEKLEADALEFIKDKIKVIELTDAERELWREATKPVMTRFVKEGGPDAAKVIEAAKAL